MQSYIWVVPSLFHKATCSDLVLSMVLCFLKQALAAIPFFIGIELKDKPSYSHLFNELLFSCYKRVFAATHSFKFTTFLQKKNCSKEILILIMIPLVIQAGIYWKKSVIWRHHFQPSILSLIVPLFHGSTWSNPHVKETVYFTTVVKTIHYNKWSVIDSRKIEGYVYLRETTVPLPF